QNGAVSSSGGSGGSSQGYFSGFFSGGLLGDTSFTASRPGEAACSKGAFWPFLRDPGDCLTAGEKKAGRTRGYRGDGVVKPPPTPAAAAQQGAGTAAPAVSALPVSTSAPAAAPTCNKGWLWPFVKSAGDCATEQERKDGRGVTQASAPPAPVAAAPQAAATNA